MRFGYYFQLVAKLTRLDSVLVIVKLNKAFDSVDWETWRCHAKNRFCLLWNWRRHLIMWIGNLEAKVLGMDLVAYNWTRHLIVHIENQGDTPHCQWVVLYPPPLQCNKENYLYVLFGVPLWKIGVFLLVFVCTQTTTF